MSNDFKSQLLSLQLNTPDIETLCTFFTSLGIAMQEFKVSKGSSYFAAETGSFQLKIFSIPQRQRSSTPDLSLRVQVNDIDEVMKKLKEIPGVGIIMDVEFLNEGKTALVSDPDGRLVEIYGLV
jgi:predicted enzyme related to lactoylglutathione lyase